MAFQELIGRSRELGELEAALERCIAGRGSVVLLSGEAGIGKTRLAEELAKLAQGRGATVVWGRAWEVEGAPPCWPWVQVLRACVLTEQGAHFMEHHPLARDLAPLLPRDYTAEDAHGPEAFGLRLGSAIVALLHQLSQKRPLVLVFDDLHASELASLNLLLVVARELRHLPVLVIGTYRELEARRVANVASQLAKLGREGTLRPLGPLEERAVTEWVAGVLGAESSAPLASAVFAATEGNPLFVDAMAHLLASRGRNAWPAEGFALPDTIRETVHELLVDLSPETRHVLDIASVLGREGSMALLQLVCEKPMDDVLAAVGEGTAVGVLVAQATPSSPVRFAHVLIRETLYQELSALDRARLHVRTARAIVRLYPVDVDERLAELAHHCFEGGALGSWLEAAEFASRAGHRAMRLFAFDDAAKHFERALRALDHAESTDDAQRADWLWRLGLARIRMGQTPAGKENCERSAALAQRTGQRETYARAALAWGSEPVLGRADPRLVELLESALELGTPDEAMRVQVMARLSAAMLPSPTPARALELGREAMAAARALGDRRVLAEVLATVRSSLFAMVASLEERTALDRELAMLAVTLEDRVLELQAHTRLAMGAIEEGNPDAAKVELRIQRQLAGETRIPHYQMRAAGTRLMWATLSGDPEEIAHAESALQELAERADDATCRVIVEANRQVRAELRGDRAGEEAAFAALEAVLAQNARLPSWPELGAWLTFRRAGESEQHEQKAAELLARFVPEGGHATLGPILTLVTPICLRRGSLEMMQQCYEAMLPSAARNMVFTARLVSLGPVAYYLGALADALGRPEAAEAHFRDALAMCQRARFVDFEARIRQRERGRELGTRADHAKESAPATARAEAVPRLQRDGEFWTLRHEGREVRLKDSKGLQYLAVLLGDPGREFHVGDLAGLASGSGDAGALLDARAKSMYQERLAALAGALEDAESRADREGVARIRAEREALADELARAVGLGGRDRKAGAVSERARINVQRRIRDIVTRVSELDAAMGRYLELHIKTGIFCSWAP